MQVSKLKVTPGRVITDNKQLEIQNYDVNNDYPQRVMDIATGSNTIGNCIRIYSRFLQGKGLGEIGELPVGKERFLEIFRKCVLDYSMFGAFALHCVYNRFGRIAAVEHVPFEYCRLGLEDEDTGEVSKIAINRDWEGRKRAPTKKNTLYCNVFNPDKVLDEIAMEEEGISGYAGQIYYANPEGRDTYARCIYEEVLTDGATQVACANIRFRNARNGFMPYGALVTKRTKDGNPDNDSPVSDETEKQLASLQGDTNAGKLLLFNLEPGDELPVFVKMDGEHYDGAFLNTEESAKANIGEAFMQPPVLRCEQVSNGFADDIMKQAYSFYNSVTEPDRMFIEKAFREVFRWWMKPLDLSSITITPLSYNYSTHETHANQ